MYEKKTLRERKRKMKEAEERRKKRTQQKIISSSKYADKGDQESPVTVRKLNFNKIYDSRGCNTARFYG